MKLFTIQDTKEFMAKLLVGSLFDSYLVSDGTLTTFTTFQIQGDLHPDYYSADAMPPLLSDSMAVSPEQEAGSGQDRKRAAAPSLTPWGLLRPGFYQLIRGKNAPLSLRLVLRCPEAETAVLLQSLPQGPSPADVGGLFLNIRYDRKELSIITGTSLRTFYPGHALDNLWDEYTEQLLRQAGIPFTTS